MEHLTPTDRREWINGRLAKLRGEQAAPLDVKVKMTERRISEAVDRFGLEHVYIAYSTGKDSDVLKHIAQRLYPDILCLFSNTTNEYPESLQHFHEEARGGGNLVMVRPEGWNFARVVREYGYPMFSKSISAAMRGYRNARSDRVRDNYRQFITRKGQKYLQFLDVKVSERCCDRLKKGPMKAYAHAHGLECSIAAMMTDESDMREREWIEFGCNAFDVKARPRSWPMAFWTERDVWDYINLHGLKVSEVYTKHHYRRNGCMFCGFGVHLEPEPNRIQRLQTTHPKAHKYLCDQFGSYFEACHVPYRDMQVRLDFGNVQNPAN